MSAHKSDDFISDVEHQFEWYAANAGRDIAEARRAGIFVETHHKNPKLRSGATSSEYAAPTALGTCSVGAVRRKVRATGSTLQPQSESRRGNRWTCRAEIRLGRTPKSAFRIPQWKWAGRKGTHFLKPFWDGRQGQEAFGRRGATR
jgi:hypothetical protein